MGSTFQSVMLDDEGNTYIAGGAQIRKVDPSGIITLVDSSLGATRSVAMDGAGNLYVSSGTVVTKVDAEGNATIIAGNFEDGRGYNGDGIPGNEAQLNNSWEIDVDAAGNVYIADWINNRIRRVDAKTGIISTVAGNGEREFGGDGGQATQAQLNRPRGVFVDADGNIYIGDTDNHRIRKVEGPKKRVINPGAVGNPLAVVVATVTQDGSPVAGVEVSFSQSIAGRSANYLWSGITDEDGQVEIEIAVDPVKYWRTGASGYYQAKTTDASGEVTGKWRSIPINGGNSHEISLPMGEAAVVESRGDLDSFGKVANYPNPFNPATTISYQLLNPGEVSLVIYNTLGQQVRTLVQSRQNFGTYQVTWDSKDALGQPVSSGVYFYRLISNGTVQTHRMLLLK